LCTGVVLVIAFDFEDGVGLVIMQSCSCSQCTGEQREMALTSRSLSGEGELRRGDEERGDG
jgi:hypothetical protein